MSNHKQEHLYHIPDITSRQLCCLQLYKEVKSLYPQKATAGSGKVCNWLWRKGTRGLRSHPSPLPLHSLRVKNSPSKRMSKEKKMRVLNLCWILFSKCFPDAKGQLQPPEQELTPICSQSKNAWISVPGSFTSQQSHEMSYCLWLHG